MRWKLAACRRGFGQTPSLARRKGGCWRTGQSMTVASGFSGEYVARRVAEVPSISARRRRNKRAAGGSAYGPRIGRLPSARGSEAEESVTGRSAWGAGLGRGDKGMKRRVAGFLLTLAATGGCMISQGEFGQMGMQN